jgi:hypothetical protein
MNIKGISSGAQYVKPCTVKSDEMSKYAGLAQENGFWLKMIGPPTLSTCREDCNKYHLTANQCF